MAATNFLKALEDYEYPVKVKVFFEDLLNTYSITDSADTVATEYLNTINKDLPYKNKGTSYTSAETQTIQTAWTNVVAAFDNGTTVEFFPYYSDVRFTNSSTIGTFTYAEIIDSTQVVVHVTCVFDTQGGEPVPATQSSNNGSLTVTEPTAPSKTYFIFQGWYTLPSGGTQVSFPYVISGKTADYTETLYAQWEVEALAKGGYIIV